MIEMPRGVYIRTDKHIQAMRSQGRCRKIAAASRRRWADPSFRARFSRKMKGRNIAWADKISRAIKELHKDPEYRRRRAKVWSSRRFRKLMASITSVRNAKNSSPNKLEQRLDAMLQRRFPKMFRLNLRDGVVISGKTPDFICEKKKLVLELFGSYWHGPIKTGRGRAQEELRRKRAFAASGYRTLIIWEDEFLSSEEAVVDKILNKLND